MSNFNELKQRLLSQINAANSAADLGKTVSDASSQLQTLSWNESRNQRKQRNETIKKEHQEAWQKRLDADQAKRDNRE